MIYFAEDIKTHLIKIGWTERCPYRRVHEIGLSNNTYMRMRLTIDGGYEGEQILHQVFAEHRERGEWFRPAPEIMSLFQTEVYQGKPKRVGDRVKVVTHIGKEYEGADGTIKEIVKTTSPWIMLRVDLDNGKSVTATEVNFAHKNPNYVLRQRLAQWGVLDKEAR